MRSQISTKNAIEIEASIDWISCTLPTSVNVVKLIPQKTTEAISNRFGYNQAIKLDTGIMILSHDTRPDMGQHVIAGATALSRQHTDYDRDAIQHMKIMSDHSAKFTRIDLCLDVYKSELDISDLVIQYDAGDVVTKARKGSVIKNLGEPGQTFYIGQRGSRKLLRIYDKSAQLHINGDWKRIEIELRQDAARTIVDLLLLAPLWSEIVAPTIRGFVDFPNSLDWRRIIGNKEIKIAAPIVTENKTRTWLINVCAPNIGRLAFGGDDAIFRDVLQRASDELRKLTTSNGDDNISGNLVN